MDRRSNNAAVNTNGKSIEDGADGRNGGRGGGYYINNSVVHARTAALRAAGIYSVPPAAPIQHHPDDHLSEDFYRDFSGLSVNGNNNGDQYYDSMPMNKSAMNNNNNAYTTPFDGSSSSTSPFYGSCSSSSPSYFQQQFTHDFNYNFSNFNSGYGSDHRIREDFPSPMYNNGFHRPSENHPRVDDRFAKYFSDKFPKEPEPEPNHHQFLEPERFSNGHGRNRWRNSNGNGNSSSPISMQRKYNNNNLSTTDDNYHQYRCSSESLTLPKFEDLRGQLFSYAMNQDGCRILQDVFEKMGPDEYDILFNEVIFNITELMKNQYGNYIFQKLVQVCSEEQRTQIVVVITQERFKLTKICMDQYGTRAVQKLLMFLTTREQKAMIVSAISLDIVSLSKDGNGNHVVVYCIKYFPYDLTQVFLNQITRYCYHLSTDQSGCCVVQSCLDNYGGEARDRLVREILSAAQVLSEDRFGNYVIQCLLRQTDKTIITSRVWEKLKGNFTALSCNKFASNVVEACLQESDQNHVDFIIFELLENPHLCSLFTDQYGNFVTQVALSASKGAAHEALVREIEKNYATLQSNQHGKMVLSWFDPKKRSRAMRNRNRFGRFR